MIEMAINLRMFDALQTNRTSDAGLVEDVKVFWSKYLIQMTEPNLVHSQFAQKHPIPAHGGKSIEFRKWGSLPKMLNPLTEGVTPVGQKMSMSTITAYVNQYGGYVETSDVLNLVAIDNTMAQAVEQIARQAHRTIDTIDREEMVSGTNVLYAGGKAARHLLTADDKVTVDTIKQAVRQLKVMNAERVQGGDYVCIIHPDISYDLTSDPDWKAPHQYVDTGEIYSGEIGRIAGVRFVESTEAKKFVAADLTESAAELTVSAWDEATKTITLTEALTSAEANALPGRQILINNINAAAILHATPGEAGEATITLREIPASTPTASQKIKPGEGGSGGRDVYATLILGANAYGVTEVTGGGLEFIAKPLGSAGSADPLSLAA